MTKEEQCESAIGTFFSIMLLCVMVYAFCLLIKSWWPKSKEEIVDEGCRKAGGVPVYDLHNKTVSITCKMEPANEG